MKYFVYFFKQGNGHRETGKNYTKPSNKYYDMFQNTRQAYLCLSDKDFLGMAAIKYTLDP
jgi:hypothetical protein